MISEFNFPIAPTNYQEHDCQIKIAMKTIISSLCIGLLTLFTASSSHAAEYRDEKVRNDKSTVESSGLWIYNNLDHAILEAKRTDKPLLVTFRCIP